MVSLLYMVHVPICGYFGHSFYIVFALQLQMEGIFSSTFSSVHSVFLPFTFIHRWQQVWGFGFTLMEGWSLSIIFDYILTRVIGHLLRIISLSYSQCLGEIQRGWWVLKEDCKVRKKCKGDGVARCSITLNIHKNKIKRLSTKPSLNNQVNPTSDKKKTPPPLLCKSRMFFWSFFLCVSVIHYHN